jgi:hypothetical protein
MPFYDKKTRDVDLEIAEKKKLQHGAVNGVDTKFCDTKFCIKNYFLILQFFAEILQWYFTKFCKIKLKI